MNTGTIQASVVFSSAGSLTSARQLLLQWILANEVKRHGMDITGLRHAAGLPLVSERTKP